MKIALLKHSTSTNIGDEIQTLAVAQHIGQKYDLIDREFMHDYDGEPCAVVMNGWFMDNPGNWPPSPKITPIFFGYHMSSEVAANLIKHKNYFSRFAPIGCRDKATAEIFKAWGIDAYVSGCATMTFPLRHKEPEDPRLVLVDQSHKHISRKDRNGFIRITHAYPMQFSTESSLKNSSGSFQAGFPAI